MHLLPAFPYIETASFSGSLETLQIVFVVSWRPACMRGFSGPHNTVLACCVIAREQAGLPSPRVLPRLQTISRPICVAFEVGGGFIFHVVLFDARLVLMSRVCNRAAVRLHGPRCGRGGCAHVEPGGGGALWEVTERAPATFPESCRRQPLPLRTKHNHCQRGRIEDRPVTSTRRFWVISACEHGGQ